MRELAFTTWLSRSITLERAIERFASSGCTLTEIAAMPTHLQRTAGIRSMLASKGMTVVTVSLGPPFFFGGSRLDLHSPQAKVRSYSLSYVKRAIDFASAIDSDIVYVCSMTRGPSKDRGALRRFRDALEECCEYAAGTGLRFAIEPFPTGELPSMAGTQKWLDGAELPDLGIIFDSGHAAISGEDLSRAFSLSKRRIVHVHLNNNDGVHDLHWCLDKGRLAPGDFRGLLIELDKENYEGVVSVELTKPGRIDLAINSARRFVEKLGA